MPTCSRHGQPILARLGEQTCEYFVSNLFLGTSLLKLQMQSNSRLSAPSAYLTFCTGQCVTQRGWLTDLFIWLELVISSSPQILPPTSNLRSLNTLSSAGQGLANLRSVESHLQSQLWTPTAALPHSPVSKLASRWDATAPLTCRTTPYL